MSGPQIIVNPSITRVSLLHQYIRMAHAMTSFTLRHCIYVDMWVWLDCGACACAHFSSFAVTPGLVCVGGLTTPTLAPVAVPCGWSARLPCVRPWVGSTSRSPRGQVQLSIAQSPYGRISPPVWVRDCPSTIAT